MNGRTSESKKAILIKLNCNGLSIYTIRIETDGTNLCARKMNILQIHNYAMCVCVRDRKKRAVKKKEAHAALWPLTFIIFYFIVFF